MVERLLLRERRVRCAAIRNIAIRMHLSLLDRRVILIALRHDAMLAFASSLLAKCGDCDAEVSNVAMM
jgi:hypothetical protein